MIKIICQSICFFLILINSSFAQRNKMWELNDQVLCNVYDYSKADSATKSFLKENFPYLTQKKPEGQTVMAPIGIDAIYSLVKMKFQKHPFFNFNIAEGVLNFQTVGSPGEPKSVDGVDLFLFFKTEQSADSAFSQLIDLYKSVSIKQNISSQNNKKIGKFIGEPVDSFSPKAIISLSKEDEGIYKITFNTWFKEI